MGLRERRSSVLFAGSRRRWAHGTFINALRLLWIILILWGEMGVYFWSLRSCSWPDDILVCSQLDVPMTGFSHYEFQDTIYENPTHIMLISDPQVSFISVFNNGATSIGLLQQYLLDLNLRKSWNVASRLKPQYVIFLGNMLARGPSVKTETE
jgi:ethanolamine phosphate phosphodiesterase